MAQFETVLGSIGSSPVARLVRALLVVHEIADFGSGSIQVDVPVLGHVISQVGAWFSPTAVPGSGDIYLVKAVGHDDLFVAHCEICPRIGSQLP